MQQVERSAIEQAARSLAEQRGLINISLQDVCRLSKIPEGSFSRIMGENFTTLISRLQAAGVGTHVPPNVTKARVPVKELRRQHILEAATVVAGTRGWDAITRTQVADRASVSASAVNSHFGTIEQLRAAVMERAVQEGNEIIVAQGLIKGDSVAKSAPAELKQKAADFIASC